VNLKLWDKKEDKLVWEEKWLYRRFTYFPITSTLASASKLGDDQAVTDAIKDLARRIVDVQLKSGNGLLLVGEDCPSKILSLNG